MAIPKLELPVEYEDIPKELERLRKARAGAQAEVAVITGMIKAVEDMCPHTNKAGGHDGYGDGGWSRCPHCGKEWSW